MADSDTIRRLWRYKSDLEEGPDEEKLIQILKRLSKLRVSISSLQETGIGKIVNSFRRSEGIIGEWAKKVVATWKSSVQHEVHKEDVPKDEPSSHNSDNNDDNSDASQNSWTSWNGSKEEAVKIKQEKLDGRNCHHEGSSSSHKVEVTVRVYSHHSDHKGNKDRCEKDHKSGSHREYSEREKEKERHEKGHRKSNDSSHRSSENRKDRERQQREHRKSDGSARQSSENRKDKDRREKDVKSSKSNDQSSEGRKDKEKIRKEHKGSSVSNHQSSESMKDKERPEKDYRRSSHHQSSEHRKDKDRHEKVHGENINSSRSGNSHKNDEQKREKKRDDEKRDKSNTPSCNSGHSHRHSHHHQERGNPKVEYRGDGLDSQITVKEEKEDEFSFSERSHDDHKVSQDSSNEDLTDSDEEPVQAVPDVDSIEQYYKAMLGQVENEQTPRDSSEELGRSKQNKPQSNSVLSQKVKSEKCANGVNNKIVDRKRKNHNISESEEEEKVKTSGDERDRRKNASSKHSDNQCMKASSSSTSKHHHKSSDLSRSKSSSSHSHTSDHSKSSSKSSNHSKSSSASSHRSSSQSNVKNEKQLIHHQDTYVSPYSPTAVKVKKEKDNSNEQSSALYIPTPIAAIGNSHQSQKDLDLGGAKSDNNHFINDSYSRDCSEDEDVYTPSKVIKSERKDGEELDSEDNAAYIPTKKIKEEKVGKHNRSKSEVMCGNGNDYSQKIKQEEEFDSFHGVGGTGDGYISEHDKYARDNVSTSDVNKYLDAASGMQSEDSDEERYSPSHSWRVKEEKTSDDHKYGGKTKERNAGHKDSSKNRSSREAVSHKVKDQGDCLSPKSSDRQKPNSSHSVKDENRPRQDSSESTFVKDSHSKERKDSSRSRSEGSKDREKQRPHHSSSHPSSSTHDKKHSKHDERSRSEKDKRHKSSSGGSHDGKHVSKSESKESRHYKSSSDRVVFSKSASSSKDSHSTSEKESTLTSSSKTSQHQHKKKPKRKPEADADFNLFSEAIHIKKENAAPTKSIKDSKKRDMSSLEKQASSSSDKKLTTPSSSTKYPKMSDSRSIKDNEIIRNDSEEEALSHSAPSPHISFDSEIGEEESTSKSVKKKKEAVYLNDSAMSFDDFLNFDEAAVVKKSSKGSSSKISPTKKLKAKSALSSYSDDRHEPTSASIVPKPSSNLSVTESDIMSLLPATQAHYRPIRKNPIYQDEEETQEAVSDVPFDPDVIGTKSDYIRSKVYSGKKHVIKEVKSLHELCLLVLMDNIDAIEHVGPIPYFILKPVLERCTAQQLYRLEEYNPHFIEDSEELWENHCKREFLTSKREELETWRELFLRRFEEREAKYQKLKANMSMTISKGQAGRPARLAYVDTVAKPPREVLRQQRRHGTGCVSRPKPQGTVNRAGSQAHASRVSELRTYKPSLIVPAYNPMNDRPRTVRPTPAMMARALQMRKNMRR